MRSFVARIRPEYHPKQANQLVVPRSDVDESSHLL